MSKTPTFQELLADFSERAFIGRHTYLALFHHTFVAPRPPFLILNIYGEAGMGKTMLLHELGYIAHGYDVLTAVTNANYPTISQTIRHIVQQFGGHPHLFSHMARSDNESELSRHFVTDLDQLAHQQRLVICFDGYEQASPALDNWLRHLLVGEFGTFSSQVLFVIASREPLGQAWLTFRRALHQIELEAFNQHEAHAYLQQAQVTDAKTVSQIIKISKGVPRTLAMLVSQYQQLADSTVLWQRGRGHFEAKAFPHALVEFSRAIELQPENDYLYHWRGRTYWEAENHTSALADFSRAIELQPNRVTYYHWRGAAYRKAHDYAAAVADFSRAIELQPNDGNNYWARGYTYREAHNYKAAVYDFSKAIELQPDNINFYYWRGRSYLEMKDMEHAWADFVHIKDVLRQKHKTAVYKNGHS
ncbi:MAG: tetratricopeptide repeat protein [Ardenticatenaceae bacterium]|nr:tetratricopeptide repeat protein [Ardenticatenaceae bacterium]